MTVDEFCKWIESSGFKDGARLPSVRKVAASQGASTFTVFQAIPQHRVAVIANAIFLNVFLFIFHLT